MVVYLKRLVKFLKDEEVKLVFAEKGRGAFDGVVYGDLVNDSILVIFDDTLKVTHLRLNIKLDSNNYYPFNHPRNLINRKNYITAKLNSEGKFIESEYRYVFTVEDYQDALRLNK